MPRTIVALTLTALAALAIAFGWACMPFGAGLSPDSVVYIAMADGAWTPRGFSLPYGYNLYEPVRHFPALYPAVLGGGKLIGLAAAPFSRIVGCALLGLNTALVGWIVYRSSRGRIGAAMAASILFGVSVPILTIHVMAWSEPLFIALLLIGMLGLSEYLVGARRMWLLIGCLATGGSAVTRYAGIAAVTATVTLLTCHAKSGRQWRDALVGGLCATLPIATWLWRNYRAAGDLTGRDFEFHLVQCA